MTRSQSNFIRGASGEQLLLLAIFKNNQLKGAIDAELDRRAAQRWATSQSRVVANRGATDHAA